MDNFYESYPRIYSASSLLKFGCLVLTLAIGLVIWLFVSTSISFVGAVGFDMAHAIYAGGLLLISGYWLYIVAYIYCYKIMIYEDAIEQKVIGSVNKLYVAEIAEYRTSYGTEMFFGVPIITLLPKDKTKKELSLDFRLIRKDDFFDVWLECLYEKIPPAPLRAILIGEAVKVGVCAVICLLIYWFLRTRLL